MAQYQKRNNAYQLIANLGRDVNGKKIRRTKTWQPRAGMSPEKERKEAQRQADIFENECKGSGVSSSGAVKFQAYAEDWLKDVAPLRQNEGTLANSRQYAKRAFAFVRIGQKRIDRITTEDVQAYITELRNADRADKYKKGELSPKTVRSYVNFVSAILEHAVKMGKIAKNPCNGAELPKNVKKEQEVYTDEEVKKILELLHSNESAKHFDFVVYWTLAIYTGFARQELLGLEYKDFDFSRSTVTTRRASKYRAGRGIYTGTLKTNYRYRTLKLPLALMDLILKYQQHKARYAESLGDKWAAEISGLDDKMTSNDRLFTQDFGQPMHPNAPQLFFQRFCERHKTRYINPHGMRHTHASIQIFAGTDVMAVSRNLGHSTANTTLGVYAHVFAAAQAAAADKFAEKIPFPISAKSDINQNGHQTDIKTA